MALKEGRWPQKKRADKDFSEEEEVRVEEAGILLTVPVPKISVKVEVFDKDGNLIQQEGN